MEIKLSLWIENKTRQDLLNDIDNAWKSVQEYEETFKMYAISNPKDITPPDYDPIGYIQGQMTDQLEFYREAVMNYRRALDFLDAWDDANTPETYQPGDIVMIKSDLKVGMIGKGYVNSEMATLRGMLTIERNVDNTLYIVKENNWLWTADMVTLVSRKADADAQKATGDPR